ncbi:hypothetical protein GCM10025857_14040 [Alicyclobacillus contaminans]|nr:hypothetical protein GCM10025857_14040 [Alicyclobacillus contaminans]
MIALLKKRSTVVLLLLLVMFVLGECIQPYAAAPPWHCPRAICSP